MPAPRHHENNTTTASADNLDAGPGCFSLLSARQRVSQLGALTTCLWLTNLMDSV